MTNDCTNISSTISSLVAHIRIVMFCQKYKSLLPQRWLPSVTKFGAKISGLLAQTWRYLHQRQRRCTKKKRLVFMHERKNLKQQGRCIFKNRCIIKKSWVHAAAKNNLNWHKIRTNKSGCKIPHLFLGASLTSTVASSEDHQEVFVLELLRKERKHQQFL